MLGSVSSTRSPRRWGSMCISSGTNSVSTFSDQPAANTMVAATPASLGTIDSDWLLT